MALILDGTEGITQPTITTAFGLPAGTTAQRPSVSEVGMIRFNTDINALENFTADGWFPVSIPTPTLASVTGDIINGEASVLTLTGTNFGIGAGTVRFTSGATVENVTVTPASQTSAIVTVPAAIFNLSASTVVGVQFINEDNNVSNSVSKTIIALPTGGTITTSGNFRIHTFTSSSNFVVPSGFSATAEFLIVAGGGGGGADRGGGGGAGGLRSDSTSITAQTHGVTVGGGGTGGTAGVEARGGNGSNSSVFSITSTGGGGGGRGFNISANTDGASGGSGGGAGGQDTSNNGGSGTSGQGNRGGNNAAQTSGFAGSGGGGAGAQGVDITNSNNGSAGGAGLSSSITGTAVTRAGGGGGGSGGSSGDLGGTGGSGGGGAGGNFGASGAAGTANTGGGGGAGSGSSGNGGNGGSGVVIIRYTI